MTPQAKAEALAREYLLTYNQEPHETLTAIECDFIAGYLARSKEAEELVRALEKIVEAWKAKQWKGVQTYWSQVGSAIAAAREELNKWSGG